MENIDISQITGTGSTGLTAILVWQLYALVQRAKAFFSATETDRSEAQKHREDSAKFFAASESHNTKVAQTLGQLVALQQGAPAGPGVLGDHTPAGGVQLAPETP